MLSEVLTKLRGFKEQKLYEHRTLYFLKWKPGNSYSDTSIAFKNKFNSDQNMSTSFNRLLFLRSKDLLYYEAPLCHTTENLYSSSIVTMSEFTAWMPFKFFFYSDQKNYFGHKCIPVTCSLRIGKLNWKILSWKEIILNELVLFTLLYIKHYVMCFP